MFLVSRAEEFVRVLCVTVARGSTEWVSSVSDVRTSRVSFARVAPRVRVGVASVSVLRENKQTKE